MLTLMSKPVRKWQVLVGKYLGIVLSAGVGVALLGAVLMIATYLRIPGDFQLRTTTLDRRELQQIASQQNVEAQLQAMKQQLQLGGSNAQQRQIEGPATE